MYASHFRFKAKPFKITTDPRFLWLGEQHKEALSVLQHGIQENQGVIVLSGGVGTGKTTLINALMHWIKDDVIAAVVSDPGLEPLDFFNYIANLYGVANRVNSKVDFLYHFVAFLENASQRKKKVLLVIDEAQRLEANLLEEIHLLANIEKSGVRLLKVFLVGQNELQAMLLKPENRSLEQGIAMHINLAPLTLDEVHTYIDYRLGVADCRQRVFTDGAIREIFNFSRGYPRLINVICDQSLISAFVKDSRKVTADMVAGSAREFRIPCQAPVHPPGSNEVIKTATVEAFVPPSFHNPLQKGKIRISSKNRNEKRLSPFFRFSYVGLALALFIFSGYLLNRHIKDAGSKSSAALSSLPSTKPAAPNATVAALPMREASSRRSSAKAGGAVTPAASPRSPLSAAAQAEPDVYSAVPPEHGTVPGVSSPGMSGATDLPTTDAPSPSLSVDKDPGAIIEWLIQKKKHGDKE